MNSRDFCYWLQGFFEVQSMSNDEAQKPEVRGMTPAQVSMIRNHLNMVFIHEIDPSMGGPQKQQALNAAHQGNQLGGTLPNGLVARC